MVALCWLVVLLGLILQLLGPLGFLESVAEDRLLGVPVHVAVVFLGTLVILIGTMGLVKYWALPFAKKLDTSS